MKKFFKKLFSKKKSYNLLEVKVRCKFCQAEVTVYVNKIYDLEQDFDDGGYILNKEVQDTKCFRIMKLKGKFNLSKEVIDIKIEGGEIISIKDI
jgi:hypothetical protein